MSLPNRPDYAAAPRAHLIQAQNSAFAWPPILRQALTSRYGGTACVMHASSLDPASVRLWDTLDRALINGEDAYRPHLADALSKHALDSPTLTEHAFEELDVKGFLKSQGFELDELAVENVALKQELTRISQVIKGVWDEEIDKLNRAQKELQGRIGPLIRAQAAVRPFFETEEILRLQYIQRKFAILRATLKQRLCSEIMDFLRTLSPQAIDDSDPKKRRRTLDQAALEILSKWWEEHKDDPYPSDEAKSILAATANLTMTQVNNWFSNKRVRTNRLQRKATKKSNNNNNNNDRSTSSSAVASSSIPPAAASNSSSPSLPKEHKVNRASKKDASEDASLPANVVSTPQHTSASSVPFTPATAPLSASSSVDIDRLQGV